MNKFRDNWSLCVCGCDAQSTGDSLFNSSVKYAEYAEMVFDNVVIRMRIDEKFASWSFKLGDQN